VAVSKIPTSVLITCIVFALIGALWGAHAAGLINLLPVLADLPVLGSYFATDEAIQNAEISPLEEENKGLNAKILELEKQLVDFQTKESKYQDEIKNLREQISQLEKQIQTLTDKEKNAAKTVEYYGQMKPKEIAPIFENLDDEKVVEILLGLEADHAAKILAELDPMRAAKLTKILTDNN